MLRLAVIIFGALLLGGAVIGITFGAGPAMLPPLLFGALILIGTVFEPHYKRNQQGRPGPEFTPTGERFADPETGRLVEVWYNQETGERRYVHPG